MIVGFDLDLTLVDSRPGIRMSMCALAAETGVAIDVEAVLGRIGPKLEWELANWFPESDVPRMADRYRELYWDHCVGDGTSLLPGARESVDAVHARGGRVLVITAKSEPLAHRCLESVGIAADWAYLVALLIAAYAFGGAFGVALLGVLRMIPPALVAPFADVPARRFRGDRALLAVNRLMG